MNTESNRPLNPRAVRAVYLVTYSQADLEKVPTRESFANIIKEAFERCMQNNSRTESPLLHWVCCKEPHRDNGLHYHMALKLGIRQRWLQVRHYLARQYRINVNFSSRHANYYQAWQYTTKEDNSYIQSANHPDFLNTGAPQTTVASISRTNRSRGSGSRRERSRKRNLSVFEVSQIVVSKGIKTRLELLNLAQRQKCEGKLDLAKFIANRGTKSVEEAIRVAWDLEKAPKTLERLQLTRFEILENVFTEECVPYCDGKWYDLGMEILQNNGIVGSDFSNAVRTLLMEGRGKCRNLLITGPSNCGKTFILNPLNVIYKTFTNPATTSFAWVGAEACEIIFLNDFRWCPQVIPWHNLLLLLEGQKVHFAAPKTHYSQDIPFEKDVPIFCTTKEQFTYVRGGVVDRVETEMMRVRWRTFTFSYQIPPQNQIEISPCGHCFARLIFN